MTKPSERIKEMVVDTFEEKGTPTDSIRFNERTIEAILQYLDEEYKLIANEMLADLERAWEHITHQIEKPTNREYWFMTEWKASVDRHYNEEYENGQAYLIKECEMLEKHDEELKKQIKKTKALLQELQDINRNL